MVVGLSVPLESSKPSEVKTKVPGFVGSKACSECHSDQFQVWESSTHGKAGGPATPKNVIGDFSGNALFLKDAVFLPIKTKDGEYFFDLEIDGKDKFRYKIDYVVGGGFMEGGGGQSYFSRYGDGTVRLLPFEWSDSSRVWFIQTEKDSWHPVSKKVSIYDCTTWPPHRVLGSSQVYEQNCENCHGSQIVASFDPKTDTHKTQFTSLSINCESCHGPGHDHVQLMKKNPKGDLADIGMKALATQDKEASVGLCLECHAVKRKISDRTFLPGRDLSEHFSTTIHTGFSDEFHGDGRIKRFQYQKNHLYSDCYINGSMTCIDCHDPHSLHYRDINGVKLKGKHDDRQCTSCHSSKSFQSSLHTNHRPDSKGSRCTACHMPFLQHPTVGHHLSFLRADHTISIPRPAHDRAIGIDNACAQCHQDKTTSELESKVQEWYGPLKPHKWIIQGMILSSRSKDQTNVQKDLLRAGFPIGEADSFARYLIDHLQFNSRPSPELLEKFRKYANSSDLDVRSLGLTALHLVAAKGNPILNEINEIMTNAAERSSAILKRRVVVLQLLGEKWFDQKKMNYSRIAYSKSLELAPNSSRNFLGLGKSLWALGEKKSALKVMSRAIELAPNLNRIQNDAGVYLAMGGLHEKAEVCFLRAVSIKKDDSSYFYNLGLVQNDLKKIQDAALSFEKSYQLDPRNTSALIALAKNQEMLGRTVDAIENLEKADRFKPNDVYNIMNLAMIHIQKGRRVKALTLMRRASVLSREKFGERDSRTLDILARIKRLENPLP